MISGSSSMAYLSDVMKKKETLNFRVSAEFKRRLIEEAKKERRSLTNYLETALTKLWERQESGDVRTVQGPHRRSWRRNNVARSQRTQSKARWTKCHCSNAFWCKSVGYCRVWANHWSGLCHLFLIRIRTNLIASTCETAGTA